MGENLIKPKYVWRHFQMTVSFNIEPFAVLLRIYFYKRQSNWKVFKIIILFSGRREEYQLYWHHETLSEPATSCQSRVQISSSPPERFVGKFSWREEWREHATYQEVATSYTHAPGRHVNGRRRRGTRRLDPLLQLHLHGQAPGIRATLQEEQSDERCSSLVSASEIASSSAIAVQEDLRFASGKDEYYCAEGISSTNGKDRR